MHTYFLLGIDSYQIVTLSHSDYLMEHLKKCKVLYNMWKILIYITIFKSKFYNDICTFGCFIVDCNPSSHHNQSILHVLYLTSKISFSCACPETGTLFAVVVCSTCIVIFG